MSWRDRLQKGSFRSVAFLTQAHEKTGGRRVVLNEYPLRDDPYTEDLGRRAREWTIELYCLGADYMDARDKLIAAFERQGSGTLVHPYLGTRQVAAREYRLRESSRDGGMATFSVTFVEAGRAAQPDVTADTASGVVTAVDAAIDTFQQDFAEIFDVANQAQWLSDEAIAVVEHTFDRVTRLVGDVTGPIAALIRTPYNMAAEIIGGVGKLGDVATQPLDAMRLYSGLFGAGSDAQAVPKTTASRRQQATNQFAVQQMVRRTAVAESARSASDAEFDNADEAIAARSLIVDAVDDLLIATDPVFERPIDPAVFDALRTLRAAVVADTTERGAKLPRLATYAPKRTLPARVIAYRLYGDASRAEEIVTRNKIRHPGFVPGGVSLEVLIDAS